MGPGSSSGFSNRQPVAPGTCWTPPSWITEAGLPRRDRALWGWLPFSQALMARVVTQQASTPAARNKATSCKGGQPVAAAAAKLHRRLQRRPACGGRGDVWIAPEGCAGCIQCKCIAGVVSWPLARGALQMCEPRFQQLVAPSPPAPPTRTPHPHPPASPRLPPPRTTHRHLPPGPPDP